MNVGVVGVVWVVWVVWVVSVAAAGCVVSVVDPLVVVGKEKLNAGVNLLSVPEEEAGAVILNLGVSTGCSFSVDVEEDD